MSRVDFEVCLPFCLSSSSKCVTTSSKPPGSASRWPQPPGKKTKATVSRRPAKARPSRPLTLPQRIEERRPHSNPPSSLIYGYGCPTGQAPTRSSGNSSYGESQFQGLHGVGGYNERKALIAVLPPPLPPTPRPLRMCTETQHAYGRPDPKAGNQRQRSTMHGTRSRNDS